MFGLVFWYTARRSSASACASCVSPVCFTPMVRRGKPEELIGLVVFLASDASFYVTGAVLFVVGGCTAA